MLNKYDDFILEKLLNESVIYFAPPFKKVLNKLFSEPISKTLLDIERTDIKPDITFVNLDKEGYVSFTTMKNTKKILSNQFNIPEDKMETILDNGLIGDDIWNLHSGADSIRRASPLYGLGMLGDGDPYEKARNPIKLGRFVNNILPGKFTAKEVEDFVNKFKSTLEQSGERFIEVSGDEIAEWYDYNNYKNTDGTLGNSCMARSSKRTFELYTSNPEVCSMLVLLEDDKLIGRALIWKLIDDIDVIDKKDYLNIEYFLDRQYTIKNSDVEKFRTYAKEKGWAYKTFNNHYELETITFNDEDYKVEMLVQLNNELTYDRFPYVDTFRKYDPKTGILYNNNKREEESIGCYILDSTSGGYNEVRDEVYSDWYDCDIDRDEAVHSGPLDDWIYLNDSVRVTIGHESRRGYYPDGYSELRYLEYSGEYCHEEDAFWSEYNREYYLKGTTIDTIVKIDEDTAEPECYDDSVYEQFRKDSSSIILVKDLIKKEWLIKLSDSYSDWSDTDAVHKDLLTKDYKEEYVLDIFVVKTFLIKADDKYYLTEEDAKLFGYEIETGKFDSIENSHVTDWFDYYKEIKSYENKITLFRDKPIITLKELFRKVANKNEEISDDYWEHRNWFINKFMQ